jgi:large subunit ribosomal protein L19|uniref:Ribosomal protein L19 n=1 Tax=Prasiola crispa TaxID=173492 RepID=A0A0R8S1N9_PRACR|nr:ribosomal protein L19 [Prasiola crispa]
MTLQNILESIEKKQFKTKRAQIQIGNVTSKKKTGAPVGALEVKQPQIQIGDTVKIKLIKDGSDRGQFYEGTIIAQHRAGISTTITVRRIFQNIGVERVIPIHSVLIENIQIVRRAKVRKAKLYYLRNRVGKSTRLKERFK